MEAEAPEAEEEPDLPGWGNWSGLGAKPAKRQARYRREIAEMQPRCNQSTTNQLRIDTNQLQIEPLIHY